MRPRFVKRPPKLQDPVYNLPPAPPQQPAAATHPGSEQRWSVYGCRCDACCEARRMAVERRTLKLEHGTALRYSYGCRCDACGQARHSSYVAISNPKRRRASKYGG